MDANPWMGTLDEKCSNVVDAFTQLYAHIDSLEKVPDITMEQLEEIGAVILIKVSRMQMHIAETATVPAMP